MLKKYKLKNFCLHGANVLPRKIPDNNILINLERSVFTEI